MAAVKQPVVAIVGHIDHGKTTLLDYIRKTKVADKEHGGITQRLSAYEAVHTDTNGEHLISFIDTPGHEAFSAMRRRSASAADIAVLIVAADDGVKPQTIEAMKAIADAKVPMIVAFTKIDKDTANIERAKESVLREGVYLEGLGGDVPWVGVSGKSGEGVSELLDLILLVADVHGITCDPRAPFSGVIIETSRDAKTGISATVIAKAGTLQTGAFAVSGSAFAPIRAIENYAGERVPSLTCGKPARLTGWSEEPKVGGVVTIVTSKKEAEAAVAEAVTEAKKPHAQPTESARPVMRLVLKADTAGSIEALEHELNKIPHEHVDFLIAGTGVGTINENDVKLVIGFSPAIILGFNVKTDASAKDLAERQHIQVETRTIIYELSEWLQAEVTKYIPDTSGQEVVGVGKVLKQFSTTGSKHVIGVRVEEGMLRMHDHVTILRRGIEVGNGKITNLQLQRADVSSVAAVAECGMEVTSKSDIVGGDQLQVIGSGRGKHG